MVEGQTVRVYSLARTVADCFRFRNKIGLDVALEALTDAWRGKRIKLDELNLIAMKLRVQRVMQPYLEAEDDHTQRRHGFTTPRIGASERSEEPGERREAAKRRASETVGESEGHRPDRRERAQRGAR